uniref:Uncharacterized protein n=1 Tax=Candidatus Kentrum eta TaxID=2126337 RepID=A0A450VD23_9GAMM|nr:MAG: hypothetical protein BECKH772A_GA0070896_1010911 [Candidatus Kentron sp. H]VFJ97368.1 MAG: hypothetical protein BECKH772B_GA0070898_1011013 [Candidatus Kentron sp. H]VFK02696.1 MAG: hypothetical protein BECKH772C_GA0070978_1009913 [Candidatus Kentron sp. H]
MATYPTEEGKVLILAQEMSTGLKNNSNIYPAPPVNPLDLDDALAAYVSARDAVTAAYSAAEQATATKHAALEALNDKINLSEASHQTFES